MHWSLLREKRKCPLVTGYYMPGQRDWMPSHNMKKSQIKINVYGRSWRTPLTALKEKKLLRRLLSKTILFTFILNKGSSIQNTHGSIISISHMCSSSAFTDSHTALLHIIPENILKLAHYIFAFWDNNVVIVYQIATSNSFGAKPNI